MFHAPLGRLILGGLLGLLRLVGRQADGSGRPMQQALALQMAGEDVGQLANIHESFSAHAVFEQPQLGQARDRVQ